MPRVVDHAVRRQQIARATWRVIHRDGVRGASVRAVAAEAGLSVGALRHYFDDHDSLLLFAAAHSVELIGRRMADQLAATESEPVVIAQGCLEQLLPLDEQRVAEAAVYFGMTDLHRLGAEHHAFRESSFRLARRLYRQLVGWLAGGPRPDLSALTEAAGGTGRPGLPTVGGGDRPLPDPAQEDLARSLQMVVDGLAINGLLCPGELGPAAIRAALRAELDRVAAAVAPRAGRS